MESRLIPPLAEVSVLISDVHNSAIAPIQDPGSVAARSSCHCLRVSGRGARHPCPCCNPTTSLNAGVHSFDLDF